MVKRLRPLAIMILVFLGVETWLSTSWRACVVYPIFRDRRFDDWKARRDLWHRQCDGIPPETSQARTCNEQWLTLMAEGKQHGWVKGG